MGRGDIEINMTDGASGTQYSFTNRRAGLLKKAHELSVLCEAEVAVVIFSSTGQLYHFSSSSVDQVLSRYNNCLELSNASIVQPEAQKETPDELAVPKEEAPQLKQRQLTLLGSDLTELRLSELEQLEQLLNEGLVSVKERKEQMLIYRLEQSRMKVNQIMLENEQLKKQTEDYKSYLATSAQPVPCFLERSQEEKSFSETHGAASQDKNYPCSQEKQIMPENKKIQKQFEEQQYFPTSAPGLLQYQQEQTSFPETHDARSHDKQIMLENKNLEKQSEQPVLGFVPYSKEKTSFPETHSALDPDAVCKSRAESVGLFTTLQLGTPSRDQRKRKEPENKTAERGYFSGTSEDQLDM